MENGSGGSGSAFGSWVNGSNGSGWGISVFDVVSRRIAACGSGGFGLAFALETDRGPSMCKEVTKHAQNSEEWASCRVGERERQRERGRVN